jgi:hypothetical protein
VLVASGKVRTLTLVPNTKRNSFVVGATCGSAGMRTVICFVLRGATIGGTGMSVRGAGAMTSCCEVGGVVV